HRKMLTALLLADHPVPCAKERTTGDDLLDALGRRYGLLPTSVTRGEVMGAATANLSPLTPLSEAERGESDQTLRVFLPPLRFGEGGRGGEVLARPKDTSSPVIAVDHQACILCDRCIRACDEIQCNEVIGRTGKGYTTRIGFDLDDPMGHSTCVSCGECVAACPTGALTNKALTLPLVPAGETKHAPSVCP